jgi:hypothetical protein
LIRRAFDSLRSRFSRPRLSRTFYGWMLTTHGAASPFGYFPNSFEIAGGFQVDAACPI